MHLSQRIISFVSVEMTATIHRTILQTNTEFYKLEYRQINMALVKV